ncbi:MAG TPA: sporulation peptidase YabG [Firmicutes bacterium]|nr:sporulation peptidase YabG [Bacillota bacterium]
MSGKINVGDIVGRKSYDSDTMFKIEKIVGETAYLKGVFFRLTADAPISDLEVISSEEYQRAEQVEFDQYRTILPPVMTEMRSYNNGDFYISGRILHIDGDEEYLQKSIRLYKYAKVYAQAFAIPEKEMKQRVPELVKKLRPNIVVITGHDALETKGNEDDLSSYRSSKYFVETVNALRDLEPSLDYLIVIAGACQSHFEALIGSGANFASSPKRINIHALDPAIIAATVALTPYEEQVDLREAIEKTIAKIAGIGGLQTKGTLRYGIRKV